MSRTSQYYNFWAKTAQTVVDTDPIDLAVSSTFPAIIYDGLETAAGLMLFSTNEQFLVITGNTDVFSPDTAMIKSIGTYKYNTKVRPVHMGQTVGFLNDAGYKSRFFELVPSRDLDYQAIETTKPVDQLVPSNINLIADSKDDNMLALATKEDDDRAVWIYRYFNQGDQRVQSAWFRWKLSGDILYHAIIDDTYYAVLSVNTGNDTTPKIATLQAFDLKLDRESVLINVGTGDMRSYDYQAHLDNYYMVSSTEMTYDAVNNVTTWRLPIGFHGDLPVVAYSLELDDTDSVGYIISNKYSVIRTEGIVNGVLATAPGDWTNENAICGFNFDMEVHLPTLFLTKTKGTNSVVADTTGYLTIHRAILDFDVTGVVEAVVKRKGRDDFSIEYEATVEDAYNADQSSVEFNVQRTIPIYNKNVNTEIFLKSSHPDPTSLVSLTWEGDYNLKNYRRA